MKNKALVSVIMGSSSDADFMEGCIKTLEEFEIPHETRVLSAHRTPDRTREYAMSAADRGIEVIIAGAGWAAHLAGVIASHTLLPVIGVPLDSSPFKGLDALFSTVQMPPGIPVATVAVGKGGARNAAILATQILALKYPSVLQKLKRHREALAQGALKTDQV